MRKVPPCLKYGLRDGSSRGTSINRTLVVGASLILVTAAVALFASPAQAVWCKYPLIDVDSGHAELECGAALVACDAGERAIDCRAHANHPPVPSA